MTRYIVSLYLKKDEDDIKVSDVSSHLSFEAAAKKAEEINRAVEAVGGLKYRDDYWFTPNENTLFAMFD